MCRRVLKLTIDESSLSGVVRSLDEDQTGEVSIEELVSFVNGASETLVPKGWSAHPSSSPPGTVELSDERLIGQAPQGWRSFG